MMRIEKGQKIVIKENKDPYYYFAFDQGDKAKIIGVEREPSLRDTVYRARRTDGLVQLIKREHFKLVE